MKNTKNAVETNSPEVTEGSFTVEHDLASGMYREEWFFDMNLTYMTNDSRSLRRQEGIALRGDAESQYDLGTMYLVPTELVTFSDKAAYWLSLAAKQGHMCAQYNLGKVYYDGDGVDVSKTNAALLFKMAAKQDFSVAQCDLGLMYLTGEGLKVNCKKAAYWFRRAAAQNDVRAKHFIAVMDHFGSEIKNSKDKATYYLKKFDVAKVSIASEYVFEM